MSAAMDAPTGAVRNARYEIPPPTHSAAATTCTKRSATSSAIGLSASRGLRLGSLNILSAGQGCSERM